MEEKERIKSFTDLHAWQEGHTLVLMIYGMTQLFPKDEQFGITNQLRRAAVSFTSNIAEGFSRQSYKEKLQFYSMSSGSLSEVQNQLLIARDVEYLSRDAFNKLADQAIVASKLIHGLIKATREFCI